MSSEALIPWFAWLAPRLLLLFGLGFLIANLLTAADLLRFHRFKKFSLLVWNGPKPRYYAVSLLLGVILGLLIVVEVLLKRPGYSLFGEAMMGFTVTSPRSAWPIRRRVAPSCFSFSASCVS